MYDFHARMYCPFTMRTTTQDPMQELFPHVSSYSWVLNNPIRYIDPDGRIVRLANNFSGGKENIARIAATSMGAQVMTHLINQREVYTLNATFLTRSSTYNPGSRTISYVRNPWYSELPSRHGGGAFNSMIAMGHEVFHAFDHSMGAISSTGQFNRNFMETRAISFENYLREAYSLSPLRDGYSGMRGNFRQFSPNERISNFTTIGHNADRTSYGFSYTKTTTIVESYRTGFGGRQIPNRTRTETTNHFMTVSRDRRNNVSFQIFDNEEAFRNATSNW